ncbi:hypothetical protein GCM10011363_20130 [Marivita lacus]|uniref:Uncharacterized protein n=2 Tax=Marivita lacus TaxID=1323742 RepID=A0ABQ1KKZ6_9RHOB|nr:hypothetical protein GCM10011363_20130 [Marivita lacus]
MKGHVAAQIARDSATEKSDFYMSLSALMCWDAVIETQAKAGIKKPKKPVSGNDCKHVISLDDSPVTGKTDMQKVPQGAFLGFFRDGTLVHAMIATGAGIAAGNKNACIGIGGPVGWELLNLAEDLKWEAGGFRDQGQRLFLLRYRAAA